MQQQQQREVRMIPLDLIHVQEGHNPRRHFDQDAFNRLVDSVREENIITAITVRPGEGDSYKLIAGERRLRAAKVVGLSEIPATIVDVDDVTARRMALVENIDRRDLSVPEEAMAARAIVDDCEGDREAAAKLLGWPLPKLQHRLLLLHASPAVLDALTRREISAGHAELLATIPADKQDAALPKIIELKLSVQQVREQVIGITLPLAKARFDLAGCAGCPHNSDVQATLFEANVGSGRCSNRTCYNDKSQAWIEQRKIELKEEFGSVALVTEKEPGTTTPLLAVGDAGVGNTQLQNCKSCAHYGALLDNRAGTAFGSVAAPTCFNLTCHGEKVEAQRIATAPPAPDTDAEGEGDAAHTPAARASQSKAKPKASAAPKKSAKAPAVRVSSSSVVEHYDRVLRDTVVEQISKGAAEPILALSLYGLASITATASGASVGEVFRGLGIEERHSYKHTDLVATLSSKDKATLQGLLHRAAMQFFSHRPTHAAFRDERVSRKQLSATLALQNGWNLQPHVRVDREFLEAHTKSAIEVVLADSGFQAAYEAAGENGAKRFKALLGMGKKDLIQAVLDFGFDFSAYTPKELQAHAESLQQVATH